MKVKIIDIDHIFDEFLTGYINNNRGKFTEKEWESKIPGLYEEFGRTELEELGGVCPNDYYKGLSGTELCDVLSKHIEQGVTVSDFLCEALIAAECVDELVRFIDNEHDEELVSYCVNILNDKNSTAGFDKYFDMLLSDETCEDMKDLLAEMLANNPEAAKERAIKEFANAGSSGVYLLEILASCKNDDRIFDILINQLKEHTNDIPFYLSYVTKYGDERALPVLMELIDSDNINYLDYKELKLAIEGFGGTYDKKRDFSSDKYYKKLKGTNKKVH